MRETLLSSVAKAKPKAQAKYRWIHDCEEDDCLPNMLLGETVHEYETGKLWWKRTETYTKQVWETKQVRVVCEKCGSTWSWNRSYSGSQYKGYWSCMTRPDVWKEYETQD